MIETLILVTCVAIMLGLAAVTIQVMLRLVADSQSRLSSSLMLERLARQLRSRCASERDRRAGRAPREGSGAGSQCEARARARPLGDLHRCADKSVDRDETAAGKRVRHESFVLPRGHQARFELGALAGRETVSLWIEPGAESSPVGSHERSRCWPWWASIGAWRSQKIGGAQAMIKPQREEAAAGPDGGRRPGLPGRDDAAWGRPPQGGAVWSARAIARRNGGFKPSGSWSRASSERAPDSRPIASYAGETWTHRARPIWGWPSRRRRMPTARNGDRAVGVVTISVDRSGAGGRRRVRVQADYPRGGPHPVAAF